MPRERTARGRAEGSRFGRDSEISSTDLLGSQGNVIFPARDTAASRLPYLIVRPDVVNSIRLPWVLVAETEGSRVTTGRPQKCPLELCAGRTGSPFPVLLIVDEVATSVGTADAHCDQGQYSQDNQDSPNNPADVEVIWRREGVRRRGLPPLPLPARNTSTHRPRHPPAAPKPCGTACGA